MRHPLHDPAVKRGRNGHYPWLKQIAPSKLAKRNELSFEEKRAELDDLLARNVWAREKVAA